MQVLLASLALLLAFPGAVWGTVTHLDQSSDGNATTYHSIAVRISGSPRTFSSLVATFGGEPLIDGPPQAVGMILALTYRGWTYPYVETILNQWNAQYHPAAVIYFHTPENDYWADGFPEFIYTAANEPTVPFPVISMNSSPWLALRSKLYNGSTIVPNNRLNVTDEGYAPWRAQRESGIYIFFSAFCLLFACINIGLAAYGLTQQRGGCSRSIAVICLSLEIVSNGVRLLFAMDPMGPWSLWPYPVEQALLSLSIPVTISSMLLLSFYWQELIDFSSMRISPFLTRSKIPAAILITCLFIFEVLTSSMRSAQFTYSFVFALINIGLYVIASITLSTHAIYVAVSVTKFLRKTAHIDRKNRRLKQFTIRAVLSFFGIIFVLSAAVAFMALSTNIYGAFYGIFVLHASLDFISLMQITAFLQSSKSGSTSATKTSYSMSPNSPK